MDDLSLLIDLHLRNDRQGPGDDDETRRAIDLARLDTAARLSVADIGCGTGASALVLADMLNADITAIDAAPAFIDQLRERAADRGLDERISAKVGQMESLPFDDNQFDLIWSEGAVYTMGFAQGVRAWRRFLRPGGVLAVTELSWTTSQRPREVEEHWTAEYPGIATALANLQTLQREGYHPLGFFFLPAHCWEANYYAPLRAGFQEFLDRHDGSDQARAIVDAEEAEMRLYREHGDWYGYAFYIARAG